MVFLIVFPSFILKKAAFLIGFNSFLLLFSYSFYLFCSFLMHDGCSFFRTIAGLAIIPFLMSFINQLPIVYCFPVYHSPYIFMFFLNHFHSFLPVSVSFHSSGRFFSLQCTSLFTGVERYRYRQETGKTHYTLSLIFYTFILHQYCLFILLIRYLSFIYNII